MYLYLGSMWRKQWTVYWFWLAVSCLHSSWYGAAFWVSAGKSHGSTWLFLLFLSRACAELSSFLLPTPSHQRGGWGCTRSWEQTQLGELTPSDPRDIPHQTVSMLAHKAEGRRSVGGCLEWWHLSAQVTVTCDGALLSWGCLNFQREVVNEFLVLPSLHA